jgi:Histidine kinase-, DNA gyrase B-, and HSP90-like ATPase
MKRVRMVVDIWGRPSGRGYPSSPAAARMQRIILNDRARAAHEFTGHLNQDSMISNAPLPSGKEGRRRSNAAWDLRSLTDDVAFDERRLSGWKLAGCVGGQRTCLLPRVACRHGGDRRAVLFVLPEYPSSSRVDRLAREYGLKDELDGAWAVRPLEFVREDDRAMLVLEDPGGEPLDRLLGMPMEVGRFLQLAIAVAVTLGKLRQRGLVAIIKNGVSVQTRLSEGLFPIQGDRVQLQQVILNLILNAVEAMGSVEVGARELLISTEQNQKKGVLVAVRDCGPGVDPEDLERVFEAFYTTKPSGVGWGCR